MDKSKKIMIACIAVLSVVCVLSVGMLIGTRMSKSKPTSAEEQPVETIAQEQTIPVPTETVPVYTEPAIDIIEPVETTTAAPTTAAPTTRSTTRPTTTKAPTTRPPTTKAPTTQPTTTLPPTTTAAPTTKAPVTTTAPTTKAPESTTARNSAYSLIVNSDSGASDFSGGGRYAAGEFVKVSMTPRLGYTFVRWESSNKSVLPDSTSQTYIFQMPASAVSLHAVTKQTPLLTVNKGKGIASVSSTRYYSPGDKVTVTAQVEKGYTFAGWSSSSGTGTPSAGLTSNSETFTFTMPDRAITLTANAKEKDFALRVSAGNGVRSISGNDGRYNAGDKVTLYVYMKDGYTFNRWDGLNASYSGNTVTFYMPARDLSLTANGTLNEKYTVTLVKAKGVNTCSGAGTYAPGTTVTVSCTLTTGYSFVTWESSNPGLLANSTRNTYSFIMPRGNVTLTAYTEKETEPEKYLVTITLGEGIINVTGTGKYAPGDIVTVDCIIDNGYSFSSWTVYTNTSVDEVRTKRYTFTMPRSDVSLTANAKMDQEIYAVPE